MYSSTVCCARKMWWSLLCASAPSSLVDVEEEEEEEDEQDVVDRVGEESPLTLLVKEDDRSDERRLWELTEDSRRRFMATPVR